MNHARLTILTALLAASPLALQGRISASEGAVRAGEWNANMTAVIKEARAKHLPMLLLLENQGCSYCSRLTAALDGPAFSLWRKDRNILLAYVYNFHRQSKKISPQTVRRAIPFFKSSRSQNLPLVYVWWPKPDGTETGKVFLGRRDAMGGESHDLLSMEFMSAVDKALGDYLSQGSHLTLDQILKDCPKKISAAASSSGGTVSAEPASGLLVEGGKVSLKAHADEKSVFVRWTDPKGQSCGHHEDLTVTGSMEEGTYTAHFRAIADILPPIPSPASTSICIQAGEPFEYAISVNDAALPVSFKADTLPNGIKFDSCLGVLHGVPRLIGTNTINIAITGSDLHRTTATNQVTLIVGTKPKSHTHHIKNNNGRQKPR